MSGGHPACYLHMLSCTCHCPRHFQIPKPHTACFCSVNILPKQEEQLKTQSAICTHAYKQIKDGLLLPLRLVALSLESFGPLPYVQDAALHGPAFQCHHHLK
mmetsp:Transcript_53/g.133  ORF Transcript_53/g.133 Transcript_53/m.133 type:complete len:102 (-) Transcript_53:651-956(-)